MARKINTNKMVALLAVLCMITSAFVGSTLAKYTTQATGSDEARVAKWGVELTAATNSSFSEKYGYKSSVTDKSNGTLAVSADTKVVAPGTADETGIKFVIKGTPEVAAKVDISMGSKDDAENGTIKEVFLKAGDYTDAQGNSVKVEKDYYPVKFTLTQGENKLVNGGKLADVEKAVEEYAATAYYAPGTKLDAEFVLTWAWDFDDDGKGTNDVADTLLGDIMAGEVTTDAANYCTSIEYGIDFRVTQVD